MTGLGPLLLEIRIAWYRWALRNMGPLHPDVPEVVCRLHLLERQRPPIETRPRSRCSQVRGMCAGDPNCEDHECAGRTWGLHQRDGGHQFTAGVVFPIEPETRS